MRAEASFSRYEGWPATPVRTEKMEKMFPLLAGYREDNPFKKNDVDTRQGQGYV